MEQHPHMNHPWNNFHSLEGMAEDYVELLHRLGEVSIYPITIIVRLCFGVHVTERRHLGITTEIGCCDVSGGVIGVGVLPDHEDMLLA